MRVFLDSSALLAASGSYTGASRAVVDLAPKNRWTLISSAYCRAEVLRNLPKAGDGASDAFAREVAPNIRFVNDQVAMGNPLVYPIAKDRPVVITALAERANVLLTLDRKDFHGKLGSQVYGMIIRTPGDWLAEILAGET